MESLNKNEVVKKDILFGKVFEENDFQNPINKIKQLRNKFADRLNEKVEFMDDSSALLYFSSEKNAVHPQYSAPKYIEDFSKIIMWNEHNIFTGLPQEKLSEFWIKLHQENGKTLGEIVGKMEELLLEVKNEIK